MKNDKEISKIATIMIILLILGNVVLALLDSCFCAGEDGNRIGSQLLFIFHWDD